MSKSYPAVAKTIIAPFIELLQTSREIFDGDIDRALVFYAIAIRSAEHEDYKKLEISEIDGGRVAQPPSLRTNARSIAESLGMPRESVRRKVQELIAMGLVVRSGNDLMATGEGLARLAPVRRRLVGMTIRYHQLVSSVLAQAQQAGSSVHAPGDPELAVGDRPAAERAAASAG